ncbi:thermonuclease family protein [Richelia sinica FACHB-800]|nr:thermonuclease family protein [Richelia sinica FACHB-800]
MKTKVSLVSGWLKLPSLLVTFLPCFGTVIRNILILGCLLLLVSCQTKTVSTMNPSEVKVARVVSGQTLEVVGLTETANLISPVRLIGVDAPDLHQRPWGEDAKKFLETLIGGEQTAVKLEFDLENQDKFGRTLAYVWKDNVLLNEEMVKQGYALFGGRSPNHKYDTRLDRAQQWARLMGQGIWSPEKPMRLTPSEFRRLYR